MAPCRHARPLTWSRSPAPTPTRARDTQLDRLVALKELIGGLIYLISGGNLARESADNIAKFFESIGQFFGAPGETAGTLWDEMMLEFSLIEGPFKECQQSIFWTSRITNFIVNIVLILWGGYGAAKLALKGIESLTLLARSGQLLSALAELPGRLWTAIRSLPASVARSVVAATGRILTILRAPLETINNVRGVINIIRLAAAEEGYFTMLRRQAGMIIGDEAQFWRDRRDFWTQRAELVDNNLASTEGKIATAVESAVDDPGRAEQLIDEADELANISKSEADDLLDDITGNPREPSMSQPEVSVPAAWAEGSSSRPPYLTRVIERLRSANVSDDIIESIIARVHAQMPTEAPKFFGEMNNLLIRAGRGVVEDDVLRILLNGMTDDNYFAEARFLMQRVAEGNRGQNINDIARMFNFEDIARFRRQFQGTPDADLINDLNSIISRVAGNREDILALIGEVGEPELQRFKAALDRLGEGRYSPAEVRESYGFVISFICFHVYLFSM